jgi:hypothetical protein
MQPVDLPQTDHREMSLMFSEIASWILSRRNKITKQERELVVRVDKAVLDR